MVTESTQGIVFFAYNTPEIEYIKLAELTQKFSHKYFPSIPTALITDDGTWNYYQDRYNNDVFDQVIIVPCENKPNQRIHYDSPYHKFKNQFHNWNKHLIIEYTPFDKTLLIDVDYIFQNDDLNYVFNTDKAVILFNQAESLIGEPPYRSEQWLNKNGIPMWWSTVIYFNRNEKVTTLFFDLWRHIKENYSFYKFLYDLPGDLYRTDYCVSIATHILNGFQSGDLISAFPWPMINMSQKDDIAKIHDYNDWIFLSNNRAETWKDFPIRLKDQNIHVMNKRALERHHKLLMEKL